MSKCIAQGEPVPRSMMGEFVDSSAVFPDTDELSRRLQNDGYLFLRGLHNISAVRAARREVFERLQEVGEVKSPPEDGIFTGVSHRREREADLGAFWQAVSEGPCLRAVTHGSRIREIMTCVLGEATLPHDYAFIRPAPVGRSTGPHCDYPFFARATERVVTVWTALGPVPLSDGPVTVIEGSHRFQDLIQATRGFDVACDTSRKSTRPENHIGFARARNTRLLSAEFGPGDMLIFGMFTWHGTLDNHSPLGRLRLSSDVRFQPLSDPRDSRYFGSNPGGTTGAGYGELNGAKPLTEPWHTR